MRTKILVLGIALAGVLASYIATAQTITFATEATYPPFETVKPSGQIEGFDADVANAICNTLKVTCSFINQPFDSLIPDLELGKFDAIIAAMNITKERESVVAFTKPYYTSTVSFAAPIGVNFSTNPNKMKGIIVGVQQGTTLANFLAKHYPGVIVKTYPSQQNAFLDLDNGRVGATLGDTPLIKQWITEHGKGKYHIVGKPIEDEELFGAGYGIALNKKNVKLLKQMNQAITKMEQNGVLARLEARYFE